MGRPSLDLGRSDTRAAWIYCAPEILEEQPNSGTLKGADVSAEEKAKYELNSTCLRISNNTISTLQGLPEVLDHVMDAPVCASTLIPDSANTPVPRHITPWSNTRTASRRRPSQEELSWLDASFNKLTSIEDIIATYPNLVVGHHRPALYCQTTLR